MLSDCMSNPDSQLTVLKLGSCVQPIWENRKKYNCMYLKISNTINMFMHDLNVKSIVVGRLDSLMMYMECLFKELSKLFQFLN